MDLQKIRRPALRKKQAAFKARMGCIEFWALYWYRDIIKALKLNTGHFKAIYNTGIE